MNTYYKSYCDFQEEIKEYVINIFGVYGKELVLRLEEYNLLHNEKNCIESSTAIGFILEEFLVSKLEMYTHSLKKKCIVDRYDGPTTSNSYDCYSVFENIRFLINVKTEKETFSKRGKKIVHENNAIAAIKNLHRNYCQEDPDVEKCYIILKVKYYVRDQQEDSVYSKAKPRHLYIDDIEIYCLEEVDMLNEHQQDNRSWSKAKDDNETVNNGRLKASKAFRESHQVPEDEISYQNTFNMLENLVKNNK